MKRLKTVLEQWGMHSFLVPVFFIMHNYIQYYGAVTFHAAMKIFVLLEAGVIVFFLLTLFFIKAVKRSLIITTVLGSIYLFFGNLREMTGKQWHLSFLSRYAVFLPLTLVVMAVCIYYIRKNKSFNTLNAYINTLLIVFIVVDCIRLFSFEGMYSAQKKSLLAHKEIYKKGLLVSPDKKYDIYYLLFDSYPAPALLKEHQPAGSFMLDTFLLNRKFYVLQNSKCNYNSTAFSMDATLNMDYLERLGSPGYVTALEYNKAIFDVDHAVFFDFITEQGYTIYNLSEFTLKSMPPVYKEHFLTAPPEKMFLFYTLDNCIKRDIFWNITKYFTGHADQGEKDAAFDAEKKLNGGKLDYNNRFLDSVTRIPAARNGHPKFIYAHFLMPHYPYFYNRDGVKYPDKDIYNPGFVYDDRKFIGYTNYTNNRIRIMLEKLLSATGGNAIIIIQSDHGYKGFAKTDIRNNFKNLNAMYFPDQAYDGLYDSMTNVNTFRVLLNKWFFQKIPLLPDSCIVVKDQ